MLKTAALFPGQASQYVGMGKDLYDFSPEVRELYAFATREIGSDLADISFNGPSETLKRTRFTQPAILAHSLAVLIVMRESFPPPDVCAGHSLGEYGALALAGALSYHDAIRLVVKRADLMERASLDNEGTMAAILGMELDTLTQVCKDAAAFGAVVPANVNSSGQIVISGAVAAVTEACRIAKERGAKRAIMLEVGGAFHSPLMRSAQDGMASALANIPINSPLCHFIPNVSATVESEPTRIRELLVAQITSPVRWLESMTCMKSLGVNRLIEIGPGKVLTGMAKREIPDAATVTLDTLADIERFTTAPVAMV